MTNPQRFLPYIQGFTFRHVIGAGAVTTGIFRFEAFGRAVRMWPVSDP